MIRFGHAKKMFAMTDRRTFIKSSGLLFAAAGTFGYQASYAKNNLISDNSKDKKGMLQHNVYFWLKEGVTDSEKKIFEKGLNKFLRDINEIQHYSIGIPGDTPDRDVVDKSFSYSILVSFKSIADHNIYQEHEAHHKFINDLSSLWTKVKVFDSELI